MYRGVFFEDWTPQNSWFSLRENEIHGLFSAFFSRSKDLRTGKILKMALILLFKTRGGSRTIWRLEWGGGGGGGTFKDLHYLSKSFHDFQGLWGKPHLERKK